MTKNCRKVSRLFSEINDFTTGLALDFPVKFSAVALSWLSCTRDYHPSIRILMPFTILIMEFNCGSVGLDTMLRQVNVLNSNILDVNLDAAIAIFV